MKMFKNMLPALAIAASALAVNATQAPLFEVSRVNIQRVSDNTLSVTFSLDTRDIRPGNDREVVFTPVIRAVGSADSLEMPTVRIAGRNRYYAYERDGEIDPNNSADIYRSGSGVVVDYSREIQWQPWMTQSKIVVREEVANCCDPAVPKATTPVALLDFTVEPFIPPFSYVALTGDEAVEMTAEGSAFIDFVVNRTEIKPSYRRNVREIAKIIESIDRVKNDPDATITRVTIKGYASPEGPYSNNVRLAMGRTASLKEYVRSHYHFAPEIMSTDYEPEDWEGLRRWVEKCTLPDRDGILSIIDSDMEPDPKDAEIKRRYPSEYKLILDSVYPALRHSDYTVKYRIRTYIDIEELKRVFASTPERLRPVDFSRIADTFTLGSPEYDEVMLKAVEIHPLDPQANVNAASIAMRRDDLDAAARYLDRAGDSPEALYTRGVLAARRGDDAGVRFYLDLAAKGGLEQASRQLDILNEMRSRPTVTYLITPTEKK